MAKKTGSSKPSPGKAKAKKKAARSPKKPAPMDTLSGWITHTEFASSDPDAMKTWCAKVLGWTFRPSFPLPDGSEYILFTYSDKGGGGIRPTNPGEAANTIPYVQVASVKTTFAKAIRGGASEIMAPEQIAADLVIAIVRAPGGVMVGFAGPR